MHNQTTICTPCLTIQKIDKVATLIINAIPVCDSCARGNGNVFRDRFVQWLREEEENSGAPVVTPSWVRPSLSQMSARVRHCKGCPQTLGVHNKSGWCAACRPVKSRKPAPRLRASHNVALPVAACLRVKIRETKTKLTMSVTESKTQTFAALMPAWIPPAQELARRLIGRCSFNAQHECSMCHHTASTAAEITHRPDCPLGKLLSHMEAIHA